MEQKELRPSSLFLFHSLLSVAAWSQEWYEVRPSQPWVGRELHHVEWRATVRGLRLGLHETNKLQGTVHNGASHLSSSRLRCIIQPKACLHRSTATQVLPGKDETIKFFLRCERNVHDSIMVV